MFNYREPPEKYNRGWIENLIKNSFKSLDKKKLSLLLSNDKKLDKVISKQLDLFLIEIEKDFRKNKTANLREHRLVAMEFKKSHNRVWKKPIDLLEVFIHINLEFHEKLYQTYRRKRSKDTRFKLLMKLHGKALLHSFEILELIKGGFADAAMGRWRSLYETAIITNFLSQKDEILSQQFLDHSIIQEYKEAIEFQKNCIKLGYKPYTSKRMHLFTASRNYMVDKYGLPFKKDYGWVINYLPEPFNFKRIEENTDFSHFRSYYKMASHGIHSGPKSILFSLGTLNEKKWMPAGPSNFGVADPGKNAAFALFWTSMAISSFDNYLETVFFMKLSLKLSYEIGDLFFEVQTQIEKEEKLLEKAKKEFDKK